MADFVTILSNFGFPVAVACYLLFRFEKKMDKLEETNAKLVDKVLGFSQQVNDLEDIIKEIRIIVKK